MEEVYSACGRRHHELQEQQAAAAAAVAMETKQHVRSRSLQSNTSVTSACDVLVVSPSVRQSTVSTDTHLHSYIIMFIIIIIISHGLNTHVSSVLASPSSASCFSPVLSGSLPADLLHTTLYSIVYPFFVWASSLVIPIQSIIIIFPTILFTFTSVTQWFPAISVKVFGYFWDDIFGILKLLLTFG